MHSVTSTVMALRAAVHGNRARPNTAHGNRSDSNNVVTTTEVKNVTNRETALFLGLVMAIVMFKRLAKKIKQRRRYRNQRSGVQSALFKKVNESNIQVRDAVFGRPVITLGSDAIDEYREYMGRRRTEFEKTKHSSDRRMATRPSTFTIPTSILKHEYERRNKGVPIVNRLKNLYPGQFSGDMVMPGGVVGDTKQLSGTNMFFSSVVEKNAHMNKMNQNNASAKSGSFCLCVYYDKY